MIVDFEFMQFENNRIRKEVCTQGQPLGISHPFSKYKLHAGLQGQTWGPL